MPTINLQIVDIISVIDDLNEEDIENIDEDELNNDRYKDKIQRALSAKNDQIIKIFGRTESDKSILVNVRGFLPFFYIGFDQHINMNDAKMIINHLKNKVNKKYMDHIIKWELLYLQPYDRFVGNDKFPYIKIYFRNRFSFKDYERMLSKDNQIKLMGYNKIYNHFLGECNLDEVLKFIHQTDIKPTSWITVKNYKPKHTKSGYTELEIDTNILDIVKLDRIINSPLKIMIYDLECQSELGELGEFPVAIKGYQKLARELIDLWTSNIKHELIKDEYSLSKVLETCLIQVFSPYFYPYLIKKIKTLDNLKPLATLISSASSIILQVYQQCEAKSQQCANCIHIITDYLVLNFPPTNSISDYHLLSKQIWSNIGNLTKAKYLTDINDLSAIHYINKMIALAFEDYYDGFIFSPIRLLSQIQPNIPRLKRMTPFIQQIIIDASKKYETKLAELVTILTDNLNPLQPRGDKIIQIGFTFQKLGTKHPYIKGIYTLDSCDNISNSDTIYDENDTEFSPSDLASMIKEINNKKNLSIETRDQLLKWLCDQQSIDDNAKVIVRSFKTEATMIRAFGQLINCEDPDMIGGYNNFGFDDMYIYNRAHELSIEDQYLTKISRLKYDQVRIRQPAGAELQKEGKGKRKMETHYLDVTGRVPFDIYRIIPTIRTLPEYNLNFVCKDILKKQKNDVPPTQIPVLQRGNSADRCKIARYCIIDCVLCNRLLSKLLIINNLIAMSNVALVPMRYLLFRGQTIKGFSLIVKKCSRRQKVVQTIRRDERSELVDKFEGAIVLDPDVDIYKVPVAVADFNSLYPSSMISENISNDTLVSDPKYDNLPGFYYNEICYDEFDFVQARHKINGSLIKRKEKVLRGQNQSRFVGNVKGILPEIEEELIANRNFAKRKKAEYIEAGDEEMAEAWDCQQNAYKITCNSIYGITGASVSPIYNKAVAASITATGRKMIIFSKNYVELNYNNIPIILSQANVQCKDIIVKTAKCVYGDSVAKYTPILIRKNQTQVYYCEIQNLVSDNRYQQYNDGKQLAFLTDCEIWSDMGWTKIKHIIRHKTIKQMYRIQTHNSIVDVTEDHSLLDANANPIKPKSCIGLQMLIKSHPINPIKTEILISKNMAWVFGLFMMHGHCDNMTWTICCPNLNLLNMARDILETEYLGCHWNIFSRELLNFELVLDTTLESTILNKWQKICYINDSKIVPDIIMNCDKTIQHEFIKGFSCVDIDGDIDINNKKLCTISQISAYSLYRLCKTMGFNVSLNSNYELTITKMQMVKTNTVEKIIELPLTDDYVYDIETENHHFSAGIGELVVHNTDSIFIKFDMIERVSQNPLIGQDAIFASMEVCKRVAKEISDQLKSPQNLDFEKTICPFLLISKKMYRGHYYEKINNSYHSEKIMGFVTKKRDSCKIASIVVDGLTDLLFATENANINQEMIRKYLIIKFSAILKGQYPLSDFIRTKSWKGHYDKPDQIAQHVLAIRQANRDPGNQFQVNDRIPFVHIINPKAALQGDKIETIDFVKRHNLPIDYRYYIEGQLLKPIFKILNPVKRLAITKKWLDNLLNNLHQETTHKTTMSQFFTIISKNSIATKTIEDDRFSSSSESD